MRQQFPRLARRAAALVGVAALALALLGAAPPEAGSTTHSNPGNGVINGTVPSFGLQAAEQS
jgi:hypothetical protein